jgi:hypothetical protein
MLGVGGRAGPTQSLSFSKLVFGVFKFFDLVVLGPGGFREAPGGPWEGPRIAQGASRGPRAPGGPGPKTYKPPGVRAHKRTNQYLLQGQFEHPSEVRGVGGASMSSRPADLGVWSPAHTVRALMQAPIGALKVR